MTRLSFFQLLFSSELADVWLTSREQVNDKSIAVLTFHSGPLVPIWSDVQHSCALPFSLLSALPSSLFWGCLLVKFLTLKAELMSCASQTNLLQINHRNHLALVFVIHCINLASHGNGSISRIIECGCRLFCFFVFCFFPAAAPCRNEDESLLWPFICAPISSIGGAAQREHVFSSQTLHSGAQMRAR